MASGDPVTSSLTAPQKQLPAWDIACSFELLCDPPARRRMKLQNYISKTIGAPQHIGSDGKWPQPVDSTASSARASSAAGACFPSFRGAPTGPAQNAARLREPGNPAVARARDRAASGPVMVAHADFRSGLAHRSEEHT